ncbi:MAG: signal recognition particle receptor subunit alpha, partial [Xanthomonadales bacterium]|nr:signal recognition particle receptor subunit alpha [Xanthomonadales bacterium]
MPAHSRSSRQSMFKFWKRKPAAADAATVPAEPSAPTPPPPSAPGWRERLRGNALGRTIGTLLSSNPRLDDALLEELETALLTADVGVSATSALVEDLGRRMQAREFEDAAALLRALRVELVRILRPVAQPLDMGSAARPFVLMVVGVNGVGKTTTIGKLAQHLQREGASVMLAAGDTFRAAAVEQLKVWGARNGVPVIAQDSGSDSASVI